MAPKYSTWDEAKYIYMYIYRISIHIEVYTPKYSTWDSDGDVTIYTGTSQVAADSFTCRLPVRKKIGFSGKVNPTYTHSHHTTPAGCQ